MTPEAKPGSDTDTGADVIKQGTDDTVQDDVSCSMHRGQRVVSPTFPLGKFDHSTSILRT